MDAIPIQDTNQARKIRNEAANKDVNGRLLTLWYLIFAQLSVWPAYF